MSGEQDVTIDAIREHHGTATVARQQDGTAVVIVPQDRTFRVMLHGDVIDLERSRPGSPCFVSRDDVRKHGC